MAQAYSYEKVLVFYRLRITYPTQSFNFFAQQ